MAKKYRKKPVVIEAVQYSDDTQEVIDKIKNFAGGNVTIDDWAVPTLVNVHTKEGTLEAKLGSYIIKGIEGEFYPCDANIFHKTYEEVL
jgi:hypothetical protein